MHPFGYLKAYIYTSIVTLHDASGICRTLDSENVDLTCHKGRLEIDCSERLFTGTRISVSCKQNYHPEYPVTRTEVLCKTNGEWDYPIFNCVPGISSFA